MRMVVALTLVLLVAALPRTGCAAGPPNVLFIAIDDLNDSVGFLRDHPGVKTPHLDRLAARGVNFTNAHCAAPACNPSRAALLSGLRPSTSGIYGNAHDLSLIHISEPTRPSKSSRMPSSA